MTEPSPGPLAGLCSCHCCGLVQQLPLRVQPLAADMVCARCASRLNHRQSGRNYLTCALALSALMFYWPAMSLPMLYIERLGHAAESSLLGGIFELWQRQYWLIGTVIFLFSVVLPPLKLIGLALLSTQAVISRAEHKALVYRLVELLGRWSMLDVLLVGILVAFVKLGDLVTIQPGAGLLAFSILVLLSLLASLAFNPAAMWEQPTARVTRDTETDSA